MLTCLPFSHLVFDGGRSTNCEQVGLSQLFIFVVSISSSLVFDLLLRGRIRARFHTADAESLVTSFRPGLFADPSRVEQRFRVHLSSVRLEGVGLDEWDICVNIFYSDVCSVEGGTLPMTDLSMKSILQEGFERCL